MATNFNKYKVEAFQSPYTQELFAIGDKEKFQQHLREHANVLRRTTKIQKLTDERMLVWNNIRASALSIHDVFQSINEQGTEFLKPYRNDWNDKTLPLPLGPDDCKEQTIKMYGITHIAPLGHPTNWGARDDNLPTDKIALRVLLHDQVIRDTLSDSIYANASKESGIYGKYGEVILFADDWPFVAVQALWQILSNTLPLPDKYQLKESEKINGQTVLVRDGITKNWEVLLEDIERYSSTYIGMPFSALKGMFDLGAIPDSTALLKLYKHQPIVGPSDISLDTLGLD